jgi:hypothetical protein
MERRDHRAKLSRREAGCACKDLSEAGAGGQCGLTRRS